MSHFLAALAPCILELLGLILLLIMVIILFIIVLFALMLRKLATRLVLAPLSAAPPHFASIRALMAPTAPVEVLLLMELLIADPAHLDA